ncbi:histidine-specific methyltransferase [Xylariaceae sp. FL0662B]|nr:histidine-specific methyltransferase [Xylariaceae sp. FL0662B]
MRSTLTINKDAQHWSPILGKDVFKAETSSSNKSVGHVERIQLHDICRKATANDLVACIVDGLKSERKESPQLLLWNDRGLSLFDAVLESPDYYPATREWSLLHNCVHKISSAISSGNRVIELGAGNMKKTALILRTLQAQHKHVQYFACDVDRLALRRCIRELQAMFPAKSSNIKIQGLLGTYEDCAAWLKCNNSDSHTSLMWLGNSMANFTPQEASDYIRSFLSSGSSMIIGLDGCEDQEKIARSYEGQCNREFVFNGLLHANRLLGTNTFDTNDWEFAGKWNPEIWMHESFYVARKDLALTVCGKTYHFRKGETMHSIRSGKWPKMKVIEICREAGGRVMDSWMNCEESYGMYLVGKN